MLNSPDIARFLSQIDYNVPGHSLPEFVRRLDVCALISRIVCDHAMPQAVHWVQSNQLIPGEKFEMIASGDAPSPLHLHPYLFGSPDRDKENPKVGIRTFGARHFIGGEILIEPSVHPVGGQLRDRAGLHPHRDRAERLHHPRRRHLRAGRPQPVVPLHPPRRRGRRRAGL